MRGRGGGGRLQGWFYGRFGCNCCTPWLRRLHPAAALGAPRSRLGVQLLHLVIQVIHWPGGGVRWVHPVGMAFMMSLLCRRGPCPAGRGLATRNDRAGLSKVVADQAEVQVPALGPAVGAFDPGRDDVRVARADDAQRLQPVQAGAHRALGQPGVAD